MIVSVDELGLPPRRSDEEIAAAVAADPDAAPIRTEEEIEAARERAEALDVYGVMRLRRRLGIAQFIFANRYKVPLKLLDERERGVSEPDRAMRVLLAAIAADPEGVARAAERADEPGFLLGGVGLVEGGRTDDRRSRRDPSPTTTRGSPAAEA